MLTLSEKQAINGFVKFLLTEFTSPTTVDATIANTIEMINVIKQEYHQIEWKSWFDVKGALDTAWVSMKPEHTKELTDFFTRLESIQNDEIAIINKGYNALEALLAFFNHSSHWCGAMLPASVLGKPIITTIATSAAINYRIASYLIEKSNLDLATKSRLIEQLPLLDNPERREYFYHEIVHGVRYKQGQLAGAVGDNQEAPMLRFTSPKDDENPRIKSRHNTSRSASPNLERRERSNSDYKYSL